MFTACVTVFVATQNDCSPDAHLNNGDCILLHSSFIRVSNLCYLYCKLLCTYVRTYMQVSIRTLG